LVGSGCSIGLDDRQLSGSDAADRNGRL